jgi:hypothetical protein
MSAEIAAKAVRYFAVAVAASFAPLVALAGSAVGAAPKGDATAVATRIIKYNFPACRRVSRNPGSTGRRTELLATKALQGGVCSMRAAWSPP